MKKSLEKDDLLEGIQSEILSRKTHDFLVAKANLSTIKTEKAGNVEGKK
jgi:hypothetical protein